MGQLAAWLGAAVDSQEQVIIRPSASVLAVWNSKAFFALEVDVLLIMNIIELKSFDLQTLQAKI